MSLPTVAIRTPWKLLSQYLFNNEVLPTLLSPMIRILYTGTFLRCFPSGAGTEISVDMLTLGKGRRRYRLGCKKLKLVLIDVDDQFQYLGVSAVRCEVKLVQHV